MVVCELSLIILAQLNLQNRSDILSIKKHFRDHQFGFKKRSGCFHAMCLELSLNIIISRVYC